MTAVGVRPGDYLLRLAFIDQSGRLGSVEHWFSALLAPGNDVKLGDLLLLDPMASPEEDLAPVTDGRVLSRALATYIEIYPRRRDAPVPAVTFSISDRPEGPALLTEGAVLNKKEPGDSLIAEAVLNIALLPPGDYFARVAVDEGPRRLAERLRPIRIERTVR
jgi:hypothetical protein